MNFLGTLGSLYMLILLILLAVGFGLVILNIVNYVTGIEKKKSQVSKNKTIGGKKMQDNGWLKLALFSFIGIVIAVAILAFITPGGVVGGNMAQMPMNNTGGGMWNAQNPMGNMPQGGGMGMMQMPMNNMGGMGQQMPMGGGGGGGMGMM